MLSSQDELLVTWMSFRLAREEHDLDYQFGVSKSSVSRIPLMWISFYINLYLRFGLIAMWPKWEDVEKENACSLQGNTSHTCDR